MIGQPPGLVINIGGTTVYHLGDTCLFGDLKLIAERTPVDVALIPIGGHYTMDRHDAVVAADLIGASTVIPIHYNTFPPIETDAEAFKADVESKTSSKVVVLDPGESHSRLGAADIRRILADWPVKAVALRQAARGVGTARRGDRSGSTHGEHRRGGQRQVRLDAQRDRHP